MRHYYKCHGKHCYLRSFQSTCPKCNVSVLYWEYTHGSKVFFEYSSYRKLMRQICRYCKGLFDIKKIYPVIVKKPKVALEKLSLNCPICGKLFKNTNSLQNHLENIEKNDFYHKLFLLNRISFKENYYAISQTDINQIKTYDKPTFGKINIKKQKKIDYDYVIDKFLIN